MEAYSPKHPSVFETVAARPPANSCKEAGRGDTYRIGGRRASSDPVRTTVVDWPASLSQWLRVVRQQPAAEFRLGREKRPKYAPHRERCRVSAAPFLI